MLLTTESVVKWNSRNKVHYTNLGYLFTKMGDSFCVKTQDLTIGSQAVITLRCDYCNKEYDIPWYQYTAMKRKEIIHKDACSSCCEIKASESIKKKYGGHKEMHSATNEQRTATNIKRYGVSNVFASNEIKSRIIETNMKKYGVKYTQQSPEIRNKTIATCREKYGVENYIELFKGEFVGENSPCWKNDVMYERAERATHRYIEWRKSIFDRDKYTCQKCFLRNGNGKVVILHAHHIKNWNDYPEVRFNVENGITMCQSCHMLFHSIYGKKNNNDCQLQEYLNFNTQLDKKIC